LYGKVFPIRNQDLLRKTRYDPEVTNEHHSTPEVRSEARGLHWIAWFPDADGKPEGSIVLVGETREAAEAKARRWREEYARSSR
jgi:hypothetical protein